MQIKVIIHILSNLSQEIQKKVRFDNNSIKYKYDVDGIIDNATYAIQRSESFLNTQNRKNSYSSPKLKERKENSNKSKFYKRN